MGIGVSIVLIAIGAILAFAVHASVSGVSLVAIGIILMVAGAIGLVVTLAIFVPRHRGSAAGHDHIVERRDVY
jgi:hypothetical protein